MYAQQKWKYCESYPSMPNHTHFRRSLRKRATLVSVSKNYAMMTHDKFLVIFLVKHESMELLLIHSERLWDLELIWTYHKVTSLCAWQTRQSKPLDKLNVLIMHSSVLYAIVMYDTTKICYKNLCSTNLCDRRLTHIICINKSHAEICCFTVIIIFNLLSDTKGFNGNHWNPL